MPEREPATRKLLVYHTIYRLNLSFANIVAHVSALQQAGILRPKFTRLYQSYAQELQAEINQDVAEIMGGIELHDTFRFGKARQAREKELRDPDDVFLEAEARRQELAWQRRKRRAAKHQRTDTPQTETKRPQRKTKRHQ